MPWHCATCGSTNVSQQVWADPNSSKVDENGKEWVITTQSCESYDWCNDCNDGDGDETAIEWKDPT